MSSVGREMKTKTRPDRRRPTLRELERQLDGLFDGFECLVRQPTERWVKQKVLFKRRHLVALCPGIAADATFAGLDLNSQRKFRPPDGRHGHHANVKGVAVESVGGNHQRRTVFVQPDQVNFAAAGKPAAGRECEPSFTHPRDRPAAGRSKGPGLGAFRLTGGGKKLGSLPLQSFVLLLEDCPAEQFIHAFAPGTTGTRALKIVEDGTINSKALRESRSFPHIFYSAWESIVCQTTGTDRQDGVICLSPAPSPEPLGPDRAGALHAKAVRCMLPVRRETKTEVPGRPRQPHERMRPHEF